MYNSLKIIKFALLLGFPIAAPQGVLTAQPSISFEQLLGSDDPYMQSFYQLLLRSLGNTGSSWFKFIRPHHPKEVFEKFERLYECFGNLTGGETRIPKIIHQIWVGPDPFPEKFKAWQKSWEALGWEYHLWTDAEVKDFPLLNRKLYEQEKNYGAKADILRIEILNQIGGLYVDVDFECIRPEQFNILHESYDFYCGITPLDCKSLMLNNALIGSIPGHPILQGILQNVPKVYEEIRNTNMYWGDAILQKGPGLITRMFIEFGDTGYKDIAFPSAFFYPLGVFQMKNKNGRKIVSEKNFFETIKKETIKPSTLAIHWWEGSWIEERAIYLNGPKNY